jgi:hypothetical protein
MAYSRGHDDDEFSAFETDENLFGTIPDAFRNEAEVFKRPSASLWRAISLWIADRASAAASSTAFDPERERRQHTLGEQRRTLLP